MMKKDFKIPIFKMGKKNSLMTLFIILMSIGSVNSWAQKPVLQQTDPTNEDTYMENRRALVGDGCVVNKLTNSLLATFGSTLNNIVDEDLANYATYTTFLGGNFITHPIVGVRDMKNHYAAGTKAGFVLGAASGASLLSVDILSNFYIYFYNEGQPAGTVQVSTGSDLSGLGISLITLGGSENINYEVSVVAPQEFDEVALVPVGVEATALNNLYVKYAFAGELVKNTITYTSMDNYAESHDRLPFTLQQYDPLLGNWGTAMIDDNLNNGSVCGVITLGGVSFRAGARIDPDDPDQSQPFKAGSTVGWLYNVGSLLDLGLLQGVTINLYKGNWVTGTDWLGRPTLNYTRQTIPFQSEAVSVEFLGLGAVEGGQKELSIIANDDFAFVGITFTGVNVELGGTLMRYAYVCDPPTFTHYCDIEATAYTEICENENSVQLDAKMESVTWSLVETPSGASPSIDANGLATGLTEIGTYVFRATSADCTEEEKCYQDVTVVRGIEIVDVVSNAALYNLSESGDYEASSDLELQDSENILSASFDDFASADGLQANQKIAGVKASSAISDGTVKDVGFVVEVKSNGLNPNEIIQGLEIRTLNGGAETYSSAISETDLVGLNVISSSSQMTKMRLYVTVPGDVEFDEVVLYNNTLSANVSKVNIYYAFVEDVNNAYDPTGSTGYFVTNEKIDAIINPFETTSSGSNLDNLTYLIDNDITTATEVSVANGNSAVIAINLGRTFIPYQQIGLIVGGNQDEIGNGWLTIETYKAGTLQETKSAWSEIGTEIEGYGDKTALFIQPTLDFDEIRINVTGANGLGDTKALYGIVVRNDADKDGIANSLDDYACPIEVVLNEESTAALDKPYEEYTNAKLVLHRKFSQDMWNSLVLPVDLTWGQFRRAFGNQAQLGQPAAFDPEMPWRIIYESVERGSDDAIAIIGVR